jgi:inosose dehydratase
MKEQLSVNRRGFFTMAGMTAGAVALSRGATAAAGGKRPAKGLKIGVASYSLRKFTLDETIEMTQQLGVGYITLKSMHLEMNSTKAEREAVAKKVKDAGIKLMGGGVIKLPNDEAVSRNAFEYARDAGMPVIVASPSLDAMQLVDKLVKEFDIKVAIHNHGPSDDAFPSPLDAYKAAQPYDERIGCCIDIGHTVRLGGIDEIEIIHAVKDRLHDFHIKDVTLREADGKTTEVGRGAINIPGVLKALMDVKFRGHVALEYEKNEDNPMPGMYESIGYIKGAIAALQMA